MADNEDAETAAITRAAVDSLLQQVAGGDEVAFRNLYDLLAPRVYGLVRRTLMDTVQSQEVTQDVLLEV